MRPLFLLSASVLAGLALLACGKTSPQADSVSRMASNAAAAGGLSTTPSTSAVRARQHFSGDYDDDDGYNHAGREDGDDDDRAEPTDGDGDSDSHGRSRHDSDDDSLRSFGRTPAPVDRQLIVTLVKSYYAALVAGNDSNVCSLIYSPIAKSLPQTMGGAGPRYLRGLKTCTGIVAKVFERNHQQLTAYAASLKVANVRVAGGLGLVLLSFKALPERQIEVIRDHNAWKIYALTDTELP
jgi:hypothetical protein